MLSLGLQIKAWQDLFEIWYISGIGNDLHPSRGFKRKKDQSAISLRQYRYQWSHFLFCIVSVAFFLKEICMIFDVNIWSGTFMIQVTYVKIVSSYLNIMYWLVFIMMHVTFYHFSFVYILETDKKNISIFSCNQQNISMKLLKAIFKSFMRTMQLNTNVQCTLS